MKKRFPKSELLVLLAAILWSVGGLLIKQAGDINALAINGIRSLFACVFFLFVVKGKPKFNKTIAFAAVALVYTNVFFVLANKLTTSANAIVLQYTSPIFVLIFNAIKFKKLPRVPQMLISLFAVLGVVLVFVDKLGSGNLAGDLIALSTGVSFGLVFFLNNQKSADPNSSFVWAFGAGFVVSIPFLFEIGGLTLQSVGALLGLGLSMSLGYLVFGIGIRGTNSATASLLSLAEAILNPIWVFLAMGESPNLLGIIGCAVVVVSVVLNICYEAKYGSPYSLAIARERETLINESKEEEARK